MFVNLINTTMGKSKQLLMSQREQEAHDNYRDDEYRYHQWMSHLQETSQSTISNNPTEVLNDLFKTFGEIFSPNSNVNERTNI